MCSNFIFKQSRQAVLLKYQAWLSHVTQELCKLDSLNFIQWLLAALPDCTLNLIKICLQLLYLTHWTQLLSRLKLSNWLLAVNTSHLQQCLRYLLVYQPFRSKFSLFVFYFFMILGFIFSRLSVSSICLSQGARQSHCRWHHHQHHPHRRVLPTSPSPSLSLSLLACCCLLLCGVACNSQNMRINFTHKTRALDTTRRNKRWESNNRCNFPSLPPSWSAPFCCATARSPYQRVLRYLPSVMRRGSLVWAKGSKAERGRQKAAATLKLRGSSASSFFQFAFSLC